MKTRISDFALAKKILEILCYKFGCEFQNICIEFGEKGPAHIDGVFFLPESGSLQKTLFSIIFLYMRYYLDGMPDEAKKNAIRFILTIIRDFHCSCDDSFMNMPSEDIVVMRLDQHPVVWILLRDIICPLRQIPLKNIRIIAGKSGMVDSCRLLSEEEVSNIAIPAEEFPLVFLNLDVESPAIRSAFLLVESLRAHVFDKNVGEAEEIIRDLFSDFFLKDRVISFARMAFAANEDESNFFAVLSILCQSKELEDLAIGDNISGKLKEAQGMADNWWFLGLTEKMLEPARSEDWTVYETWKPVTEELWNKVETERRKRGLDEVPFELLLRIQSEDFKTDETQTLQSLLSDDRIW